MSHIESLDSFEFYDNSVFHDDVGSEIPDSHAFIGNS